jgi:hypothetical protein
MEIPYSSRYRLDNGFLMDVEKHQFLLAASFANPEELNECLFANWALVD